MIPARIRRWFNRANRRRNWSSSWSRVELLEDRIVPAVQTFDLADISLYGASGSKDSSAPSISADGQLVAFLSDADNLVPNDSNNLNDAFVYNRTTGTVTLVSVGLNGYAAGCNTAVTISPDGRYVAFENGNYYLQGSILSGISGDQLYLRDLATSTTAVLSSNASGTGGGNRNSYDPVFSADSRHVAFRSRSDNLATGFVFHDTSGNTNVYERDLNTGTTQLVSVGQDGVHDANANTGPVALSADGRVVVFGSTATNLTSLNGNGIDQVYARDMVAGVTTMVSVNFAGQAGGGGHNVINTDSQVISADGRYVVFHSGASDLVSPPTSSNNAFLRDLQTGTTMLVGPTTNSEVLSPDGRWVAFATTEKLTSTATSGRLNVYVRNVRTGELSLASVNMFGTAGGNGGSGIGTFFDFPGGLWFSADGSRLAFRSLATDLTPNVVTATRNLYVRNLDAGTTQLVTPNLGGTDGGAGDSDTVSHAAFSSDGKIIAFENIAGNLVANDNNLVNDVFARDLSTQVTTLASVRSPLLPAAFTTSGSGTLSSVSADGRYVVFTSNVFYGVPTSDLAPGVTFESGYGTSHVFVRDTQTGAIQVVDLGANGVAKGGGGTPVITPDGRYVAFLGGTALLPPGIAVSDGHDTNVFVRDLQTQTTSVVSLDATGTHDAPGGGELAISSDGRYVAWTSHDVSAVAGVQTPPVYNQSAVFLRDRQTGTNYFVSHDLANDGAINGYAYNISLSADGRYLAYRSNDPNLAANDTNNGFDVFRWDRTTGLNALVSVNLAGTGTGNGQSASENRPVMTPDGRYIAFDSAAGNLVAGDSNGRTDVFVRDMQGTGTTTRVSVPNSGGSANNDSVFPTISDDGSRVAFLSNASNLTAAPSGGGGTKTFVRDLTQGITIAATVNTAGATVYGGGRLSPNGRYVFFGSDRTDLVANFIDGNGGGQDLYVRDLQQNLTKLVTYGFSGTASGNGNSNSSSYNYRIAGDSSAVYFDAEVSNLFAGDHNGQRDVFGTSTAGYSLIRGQVFRDANGNGSKDGGDKGLSYWTVYIDANANGQFDSSDPYALTDLTGNYSLNGLTPGTYAVAIVPQPGYTQTMPAGTYSVTIATDGTTISGKDFGEVIPIPDLANSAVSFTPASASAGQSITVHWTVKNQGNTAAVGSWEDAIFLSPTPTLGVGALLLTTVPHNGGLALNGQYAGIADVALPATPGDWYVIVRADSRNQVQEGDFGTNKSNNVAASASTVNISIPTLAPNSPVQGTFTGIGSGFYYQISVAAGQTLTFSLTSAAGSGGDAIYVRRGAVPTPDTFDFTARVAGQANQTLTIPTTAAGTYDVYVRSLYGAASTAGFTLTASLPTFGITAIDQTTGGNTGRVTIPIHGTLLTTSTNAVLVNGGTVLAPVAVSYQDASTLYATFDLTGIATGTYGVRLTDGAQSATLAGTFSVVAGHTGTIEVSLSVPSAIRAGGTDGVVVRYTNTGNVDAIAPLITLSADHALFHLPDEPNLVADSVQFLGISTSGPAGILRPGESGEITIPLRSTAAAGQDIHFSTQIADDTAAMDWAAFKDSLRMDHIPPDAWDAVYANFTAVIGTTVGSYHAVLAADASYLGLLGERTPNVARLLSFEFNKAAGVFTSQTLTTIVDASFPAPGLSLTFVRQFQQSLIGRYTVGPFGRGWTDNWQYEVTADEEGNVDVQVNGIGRYFALQRDGGYLGAHGDLGSLSLISGKYQLRETDGSITAFKADGTFDYVQDSNGNRITATYTSGLLTKLKHSDGDFLTITYTTIAGNSLIHSVTDPGGRVTTYGYDATGQQLTTFTDEYGITQYTYLTGQSNLPLNHALSEIAYADNTHLFYGYDGQGRLVDQHRDGNLEGVTYTYGAVGGYTVTNAVNAAATFLIDDAGQVRESIDPLGRVTRFTYDANRHLTQVTAPLGTSTSYHYDNQGNVTSTLDSLGNTVSFTYDTGHHLTGYTDARGNTTGYQPDAAGNLLSITYPAVNGATTSQHFQYDPLGNLSESLNARGQAMDYIYFPNGQLKTATFADATTQQYQYDAHGNLTQVIDRQGGVTALQYDAADNLKEIDYPDARFLKFTYNVVGQRLQSQDQDTFTVNYHYDALGRLDKLTDGSSNLIVSYAYDAAGQLIEKDLGNGTYSTYQYDLAGSLIELINRAPRPGAGQDGPVNSEFDYTYDEVGRMVTATTSDGDWGYSYDADSQLTGAVFTPNGTSTLTAQDLQYSYDAAGNRTQTVINGVTTLYTADARNEYTQVGDSSYTFDADGNLATATTGGVTTTYSFNQINQLTGIATPGHDATPADVWSHAYDAFGNRTGTTHNGATTTYQFDPIGLGNLVAAFDSTGSLTTHYTYGMGLVSQVPVAGAAGFYDFDLTGNTAGITGAAGTYLNKYAYLPFGQLAASSGSLANPFTFVGSAGGTSDGSGLLNMRARNYDLASGQFISNDPLSIGGGDTNLRRYVGNSPTDGLDPTGLCEDDHDDYHKEVERIKEEWHGNFMLAHDPLVYAFHPDWYYLAKDWLKTHDLKQMLTGAEFMEQQRQQFHHNPDFDDAMLLPQQLQGDPTGLPPIPPGGGGTCPCACPAQQPPPTSGNAGPGGKSGSPGSFDPNELIGPAGFGDAAFVGIDQTLPYTIGFENDPVKATAAAQIVVVTEQLDTDLDWFTFAFGDIQIGSLTILVPAGLQSFATIYDTKNIDGTPLTVSVSANLNLSTGIVTWTFLSIDPATGLAPTNPVAGFLLVDDNTGRGQGYVHYTVRPKSTDTSGTVISAQASIVFDTNQPIDTPTAQNTLDADGPTSTVSSLAAHSSASFPVSWSGSDDVGGSGIAGYDVYVSDNNGAYTLWQSATAATSATYTGLDGHTYRFYSVAHDNVGHVEAAPETGDALTTVEVNTAPVLANLGEAPTFMGKAKTPVKVFPSLTVTDADGSATLATIVISLPLGKAKKNPDVVSLPGLAALGTRADANVAGRLQITITLREGATNAAVQAMLEGLTFQTKGAGLKIASRGFQLRVTDRTGLQSNLITQTLTVRKK